MAERVLIFGCGYTGKRLALRLAGRGIVVCATSRHVETLPEHPLIHREFFEIGPDGSPDLSLVSDGVRVLYSIPTLDPPCDPTPRMFEALGQRRPKRLVYLSTTGVYGGQPFVDAKTRPAPRRPQDHARVAAESAALRCLESSMVLRPAAIYGPGRGIHVSMREGRFRMGGDGSNYVSRIHVDDLAAHCEAALFSEETGAWPVSDEHPCTTREIAEYCAREYGYPMPPTVDPASLHHTRQANRCVDGSAVRDLLGIKLAYPSYRDGIPASVS